MAENIDRNSGLARRPILFWFVIAGVVLATAAYVALGVWFNSHTGFDGNVVHCHRNCLVADLTHSSALLRHGGLWADLQFAWLWVGPAAVLTLVGRGLIKRAKASKSAAASEFGSQDERDGL